MINIFKTKKIYKNIETFDLNEKPNDIYIIGNGPSLNKFKPKEFKNKFTIGTNRSWLWGKTDLLIWRDHRITEEINFFNIEKNNNTIWICSEDKSFVKENLNNYNHTKKLIDYTFNDNWIKNKLNITIKWNGIVFHAITLAKHISINATIHLIGIDLTLNDSKHHFFYDFPGFNQGYYNKSWDGKNFNFKSRLDMMYKNFETMKENGFIFKNYSENSRLKNLFGIEKF
tara:strand:- start:801 stop:1484 length:684 start_codon:yes stop_codon:yes gene_type:complete